MTAVRMSPAGLLAYRQAGWHVHNGLPDAGVTTGPCARCRQPHTRYGEHGRPVCANCQTTTTTGGTP